MFETNQHHNLMDGDASFRVTGISGDAESNALIRILGRAFDMGDRDGPRYLQNIGPGNFRAVRSGETIVGGLAIIHMGQHFGGRAVPMAGIAAVGIEPSMRGQGVARTLMISVLREMRRAGYAISSLYPATQTLYRAVGYEIAGSQYEVTLPLNLIHVREPAVSVRPVRESDFIKLDALHRHHAQFRAGTIQRNDVMWNRIRTPRGKTAEAFVLEQDGAPVGYVFYVQKRARNKPYSLHITDILAIGPVAARGALAFLAEHRSVGEEAIWFGAPMDPILASLPENVWKIRLRMHWMTRILNVKAALEARGYASCVNASLNLHITDEAIPENNGVWSMHVGQGSARVEHISAALPATLRPGDVRLSIRALAPLYTGFMSADDGISLGWLDAANGETIETMNSVFAGPSPFMSDGF